MEDLQNSSGFFKTHLVSTEALIPSISNFNMDLEGAYSFSNTELNIPQRLMLGKRAERYFSEWLNRSSLYELIAENIQVIEEKQTLGEFDFIVRRKADNQLIHVELVYKFYLFDSGVDGEEKEKWIGPNRGDRLDYKLDKLANHQFPLLFTNSANQRLKEFEIDTSKIEQQVLFFGNLFVPVDQSIDFVSVNKDAVEGTWMNLSQWEKQFDSSIQFAIPDKIDWFSRELKSTEWLSREEAFEKIKAMHEKKRSPLVYSKRSDGTQLRDFVVWW